MLTIRKKKPDHMFLLLVPTISIIRFKDLLHFPDGLQPFWETAELKTHDKALVEFYLPRAPPAGSSSRACQRA